MAASVGSRPHAYLNTVGSYIESYVESYVQSYINSTGAESKVITITLNNNTVTTIYKSSIPNIYGCFLFVTSEHPHLDVSLL